MVIGVLICLCLGRRRKAEQESDDISTTEKGIFRPALKRKWTELTGKGTPRPTPQIAQGTPVTVDEDHHIIRMDTNHWSRPFAQGYGEGWRESIAPAPLRVTNPDPSRASTPRLSDDTAGSFLKRQRGALTARLASAGRSRSASRLSTSHSANVPEITIDPALSREGVAMDTQTPSFRSYSSISSVAVVNQHGPEDPFLTPPDERAEELAPSPLQQRPKRPGLTPLQSSAGVASRTLSFLNPFRTRSGVVDKVRSVDGHSVSTLSSAFSSRLSRREAGYSDPFDLDRPSVRGSEVLPARPPPIYLTEMERRETERRLDPPIWVDRSVYEGT